MRKIRLTRSAANDLDEIWNYIAVEQHSPIAADGVIDEVDSKLKLALEYPQIGEAVDRLRPNTRRLVVKKRFLLFYEDTTEGILLLRALHGAKLIGPEDLRTCE